MAGLRVDVTWCPAHSNRFLVVGTDLQLYEISEREASTADAGEIAFSFCQHPQMRMKRRGTVQTVFCVPP